ncbi:hypothetical protein ACQKDS_10520 [Serratia sp. NPDC078593]|uniref:hypothetical protein n=1 Tax=unclassified Serratia (in: enterobacteria) TaxID=2647522 RepID=UPI0037D3796A
MRVIFNFLPSCHPPQPSLEPAGVAGCRFYIVCGVDLTTPETLPAADPSSMLVSVPVEEYRRSLRAFTHYCKCK